MWNKHAINPSFCCFKAEWEQILKSCTFYALQGQKSIEQQQKIRFTDGVVVVKKKIIDLMMVRRRSMRYCLLYQ
jgi:hypothetical protein